jgi:hypothetical protein
VKCEPPVIILSNSVPLCPSGRVRTPRGFNTTEDKLAKLTENCIDLITMEELETNIKAVKSRKSPGSDGINNELYKHAKKCFLHKFRNFLNDCWIYGDIPEEWRKAIVMQIHKN